MLDSLLRVFDRIPNDQNNQVNSRLFHKSRVVSAAFSSRGFSAVYVTNRKEDVFLHPFV